MGWNKQQNKCSFTTDALRAHGGSGSPEAEPIFMSAVSEVVLTTRACLLAQTSFADLWSCKWNATMWSHIGAAREGEEKNKSRAQRALRSSGNYNQTMQLLVRKANICRCDKRGVFRALGQITKPLGEVMRNEVWCNWKKFRIHIYWTKWPSHDWYRNYNPHTPPSAQRRLWTVNNTGTRLALRLGRRREA